VGAGIVVLAAVAGSIAVTRGATPEAKTEMSNSPDLPAVVLDVDGWELTSAEDTTVPGPPIEGGSTQVFVRDGDPDGPRIELRHSAASDTFGPPAPGEEVREIGGQEARLTRPATDEVVVRWQPPIGDNLAEIDARGVSEEDVLAFAQALQPKYDGQIQYPAAPEIPFGFVAGSLPEGFAEVPAGDAEVEASNTVDDARARHWMAERGDATAELTIADANGATAAWRSELPPEAEVYDLTVLGRPATLVPRPAESGWELTWQPRDGAIARLVVSGVDVAAAGEVTDALREINDDEWDDLVAAHGG
jgi:hypothetical protein